MPEIGGSDKKNIDTLDRGDVRRVPDARETLDLYEDERFVRVILQAIIRRPHRPRKAAPPERGVAGEAHDRLRRGRTFHPRHHDPVRAPVEDTGDLVGCRCRDADDTLRCGAPDRTELIAQGRLRDTTVFKVEQDPVESGKSREFRDDRRSDREPGAEGEGGD